MLHPKQKVFKQGSFLSQQVFVVLSLAQSVLVAHCEPVTNRETVVSYSYISPTPSPPAQKENRVGNKGGEI